MGSGALTVSEEFCRSLYFTGKENVEIRKEPLKAQPEQILITSRYMGISSGTEMLFYRGKIPEGMTMDESIPALKGGLEYPVKYGYINTGLDPDDRPVFAFFPHQDKFYINPKDLIYLPEDISLRDAVFIPAMETAVAIHHALPAETGSVGAVFGLGAVGLLVAELAVLRDACTLFAVDPVPERRVWAQKLGVAVFPPDDPELTAAVKEKSEGRGLDWAVNVSASGNALQYCIDNSAFGAVIIEGSWYGTMSVPLYLGGKFHRNRLVIKSVQVSSLEPRLLCRWTKERRMKVVMDMIRKIGPAEYIGGEYPLERAEEAFRNIAAGMETGVQTVIYP